MQPRIHPIVLITALLGATFATGCRDNQNLPERETVGAFTIVRLTGSPYEMGLMHGRILKEELTEAVGFIETEPLMQLMFGLAKEADLDSLAAAASYPAILDECQGVVDGAVDSGLTMEHCLLLNFGDVIVERILHNPGTSDDMAPGCSQVVARGSATSDGRMYHARLLDWDKMDFIIEHPVLFVREPTDGIAHVTIGFPGNLSPYSGMNIAGLSMASNENYPPQGAPKPATGRSHVQLLSKLLTEADSLASAGDIINDTPHMSMESIVISDGDNQVAQTFELAPNTVGIRALNQDLLIQTNHFLAEATQGTDKSPTPEHSAKRHDRFTALLATDNAESHYGQLDPLALTTILRDRVDPWTGQESELGVFDDASSIATNGALYAIVFDPERRHFWVAAGELPVPEQSYQGFSLYELLGQEDPNPLTVPQLR